MSCLIGCAHHRYGPAFCGSMPTTHGFRYPHVAAVLQAPATARSGSTVHVTVLVRAVGGVSTSAFQGGQPPNVYIVQRGRVVGEYEGAIGGTGIAGVVTSAGLPLTTSVVLTGCPARPVDLAEPDRTRAKLKPGQYQLVGTVDTSAVDARPGPSDGILATEPVAIRVT